LLAEFVTVHDMTVVSDSIFVMSWRRHIVATPIVFPLDLD